MSNYLTFIAGSDIDYFYQTENFLKPGDACIVKPLDVKVGGCVLNAASVCAKLGSNVKVLDYLKEEDENTDLIVNTLKNNNVDTSNILFAKDVTNGKCLIMCKENEKCIFVVEPNRPFYKEDDSLKELLFNSKYVYSLMETLRISFKDINILKEAKNKDVKFIFDAGSQYRNINDKNMLFELASGLFMNKESYNRLNAICNEDALKELFNKGLEFACITDGDKGADLYLKDKTIHEDSKKVKVVDSTGAGDSFAGSFMHFLNEGLAYEECLKYASYSGAYACLNVGGMAGVINKNELIDFINKLS